jgi:hypothetical protein
MERHSFPWVGRLYISKMAIMPKSIYRFNTIHTSIPADYFAEIDKLILKFIWKWNAPKIANSLAKNKVEELILPSFKVYYETTEIKTV